MCTLQCPCVDRRREKAPQEAREHGQAPVGLTAPISRSMAEGPKSHRHRLVLLPIVTGWPPRQRKPEPPITLTPGLRGWRPGVQV